MDPGYGLAPGSAQTATTGRSAADHRGWHHPGVLALALALGSSLCWGVSDFAGGLLARRVPLAAVMLVSQAVGLAGIALIVAAAGATAPAGTELLPAAIAGAAGAFALSAFYRALAVGTMSIVAPISATGVAVPVAFGVAGGDRPGAVQVVGMAVAVAGVVLASREPGAEVDAQEARHARRSIALALLAALGFGTFFVGMDAAAEANVFWALLIARSASVGVLVIGVAVLRPSLRTDRRSFAVLAGVGGLDLLANTCFALASTHGLLSLVSVAGSLYPVATVLLARAVLGERVSRGQEAGIVLALAGVALIAAG